MNKFIIHNYSKLSGIESLEYAIKSLNEIHKELEIGDSRYFVFNTNIKVQVEQRKTCKTIIIY